MIRVKRWYSVSGAVALGLALSAASCGSGTGGADAGRDGGASAHGAAGGGSKGDAAVACMTDADCAASVPPTVLAPGVGASCAAGKCSPLQGVCEYVAKDEDGDGHQAANCMSTNGVAIQEGDDCDDQNPKLYPGHPDKCSATSQGAPIDWPTGSPTGLCQYGQVTCQSNGKESACEGSVGPAERVCSSAADNDCDGMPDDTECDCSLGPPAATQPCFATDNGVTFPSAAHPGMGPCKTGIQTCGAIDQGQHTTWGACVGAIGPQSIDSCDPPPAPNSDANCDGVPNEGCQCVNGASEICNPPPACNSSTVYCANGVFPQCPAAQNPTFSGATVGSACSAGIGACKNTGTVVCQGPDASGNYSASCSAAAGNPSVAFSNSPAPNGSWDWNCDGTIEPKYTLQPVCPAGFNCACIQTDADFCHYQTSSNCQQNNPQTVSAARYLNVGVCQEGQVICGGALQVEWCEPPGTSGGSCATPPLSGALCGIISSNGGVEVGVPCQPTQACR